MRRVDIYVENQRLELFQDEQIIVNSSIQDIGDISSVGTDFTQQFTIPCSNINNSIFEYYFENALTNQIDHNLSRNSRIEIDGIPFKIGKIQLEKSEVKGGVAENYTVSFDGDLVTLKDLVKDDKLKSLDYTTLNHDYNGQEVQDRIEGIADYDVCYPLITSNRVWQHGDTTSNDISIVGGAITSSELFPAVRISSLLSLIETKYTLDFIGSWLSSEKLTQAFLYFKNKETFTYFSQPIDLVFAVGSPSTDFLSESKVQYKSAGNLLTGSNDIVTGVNHSASVQITTASSIDYYLDIYKDGVYLNSKLGNGSQNFGIFGLLPNSNITSDYTFKVRSTTAMTFTGLVTYTVDYVQIEFGVSSTAYTDTYTAAIGSTTTLLKTDLSSLAPDITILDFLKGLFNMFNLTTFGVDPLQYKIQPLDLFYNSGMERNITPYLTDNDITVERPKLFKNIKFEYQKSLSVTNQEYFDLFGKEYGNLSAQFDYDGGDFNITLPFENLMHSKFDGTNIQVGYCVGTAPEYKNYIPKPMVLFRNVLTSVGIGTQFWFNNGTTTDNITSYIPFGQDYNDYSLNFGSDISTFTQEIVTKSLYQQGYEDYLNNLYNPQTRQIRVKAEFPLSIVQDLKLNDSLLIRDKKYIINDVQQNLVTGEASLTLLSNWRNSLDYNAHYFIDYQLQDLAVYFSIPSDVTITIGACVEPVQFATPDVTVLTDEIVATFTCTANATSGNRTNTFALSFSGVTIPDQALIITQSPETGYIIIEGTAADKLLDESGNKILYE